jgi:hypothetical protein
LRVAVDVGVGVACSNHVRVTIMWGTPPPHILIILHVDLVTEDSAGTVSPGNAPSGHHGHECKKPPPRHRHPATVGHAGYPHNTKAVFNCGTGSVEYFQVVWMLYSYENCIGGFCAKKSSFVGIKFGIRW